MIDYFSIIRKYIDPNTTLFHVYLVHVSLVTNKALQIAKKLQLSPNQLEFIEEASMLHDIGVSRVKNQVNQKADLPYICHGHEGAEILRAEGLPHHALVAERHTGVGIHKKEIVERDLPLPHQDFIAESMEEKIISFADLFFSKSLHKLVKEETPAEIKKELSQYGDENVKIFEEWQRLFS